MPNNVFCVNFRILPLAQVWQRIPPDLQLTRCAGVYVNQPHQSVALSDTQGIAAGDAVEEGEGVSWVTYTLATAGAVTIEAILPGEAGMRSFRAVCMPAAMSLAHSALMRAPGETVAGETCSMVIKQCDRYPDEPFCQPLRTVHCCLSIGPSCCKTIQHWSCAFFHATCHAAGSVSVTSGTVLKTR